MLKELYQTYLESTGVCTDTRSIAEGNIYFALKGPSFNGNLFAQLAVQEGAKAVVIDEDVDLPAHCISFKVDDVLTTLQDLARYHRQQCTNTTFIGLTGSNGKTTAKELFNSVFGTTFKTHATKGNLNNHIGLPLTLLSMPADTEIAIVEMGANHRGEIEMLSGIALPDYGYITNFGKAHLEGFGGIEGVIEGKSELYKRMLALNGTCIVNGFDPIQLSKSSENKRIIYGPANSKYPMQFSSVNYPATVSYNGMVFTSHLTGNFHTASIGAAIALGHELGVSTQNIALGLKAYQPQNNRSQWTQTEHNRVMLDAYNANPSSMSASIRSFVSEVTGKATLILGDMFELGDESAAEHQAIVHLIDTLHNVEAILVGKHFSATNHGKHITFETTEDCEKYLSENPIRHASILLKGSRGMHLETLYSLL